MHKTIVTGTCHFVSRRAAITYYARQGDDADEVRKKLDEGAIHLGPPNVKPHQKWRVNHQGRYEITELASEESSTDQPEASS